MSIHQVILPLKLNVAKGPLLAVFLDVLVVEGFDCVELVVEGVALPVLSVPCAEVSLAISVANVFCLHAREATSLAQVNLARLMARGVVAEGHHFVLDRVADAGVSSRHVLHEKLVQVLLDRHLVCTQLFLAVLDLFDDGSQLLVESSFDAADLGQFDTQEIAVLGLLRLYHVDFQAHGHSCWFSLRRLRLSGGRTPAFVDNVMVFARLMSQRLSVDIVLDVILPGFVLPLLLFLLGLELLEENAHVDDGCIRKFEVAFEGRLLNSVMFRSLVLFQLLHVARRHLPCFIGLLPLFASSLSRRWHIETTLSIRNSRLLNESVFCRNVYRYVLVDDLLVFTVQVNSLQLMKI